MNEAYSLRGITRVGSKGMISARNIKAPHCCLNVGTFESFNCSEIRVLKKKKEKQSWKRTEFLSGTKISYLYGK
jgi:transcriptional regulator NrdR family protein